MKRFVNLSIPPDCTMKNPCSGNPLANDFSRRGFLQVGLVGGLGLTLPQFLRMEAHAQQKHYKTREGVARSIIQIFLPGGMAHQESWDPKPYAPSEYRGPFGTINTSIKGIKFSESQREAYMKDGGSPDLDMDYTVFGQVISGMEVVDAISAGPTGTAARPVEDIVIESVSFK